MKKKHVLTLLFSAMFIAIVILAIVWRNNAPVNVEPEAFVADSVQVPPATPKLFGLVVDTFDVIKGQVKNGDSFGKLTGDLGLGSQQIFAVAQAIDGVFDVRKIRIGNDYTVLKGRNSSKPSYFIYEESLLTYYLVALGDSIYVKAGQRTRTIKERFVTGVITNSLYETLAAQQVSTGLTMKLADIYAWTIDFFRIQKGDSITVLYEDVYVDDTIYAGTGRILAARFDHFNEPYFAFRYTDASGETDYYDEKGNSLRKAFLKAPLQYSRISSRYTQSRYHPVQKRWKPHLGTDYAAPQGTPIMTTADGVVEKAGYTSGNGNYVKVRHNSTYSTQYLHMSKIAKGMKPGVRVRQGEVIGYVGSTGLATGPHVCYRFWVNGKQVDPYKQKLPDANPIKDAYRADFMAFVEQLKQRLNQP